MRDSEFIAEVQRLFPTKIRIGKTGRVRLSGLAIHFLRVYVYQRDSHRCQTCGIETFFLPRFYSDPLAYHMAHIQSRGAGGSDLPSNVRVLCCQHHMDSHNFAGKPIPII